MRLFALLIWLTLPVLGVCAQEMMDSHLSSRFEFDRHSYHVSAGDTVTAPVVTKQVLPDSRHFRHPPTRRIRDTVVVACVLKADGTIGNLKIVKSIKKGHFGFDQAAKKALSKWEFQPGTKNGKAIDVKATVTFNFN
jgi:TonB family protein